MKINGVELEDLDIYDLEVAKKYESVMQNVVDLEERVEGLTASEGIELQCNVIFDVFNTMFGEGTDKKIFGERVNLILCIRALEEFILQMDKQKKEIEAFKNKYSPNRAQRRK